MIASAPAVGGVGGGGGGVARGAPASLWLVDKPAGPTSHDVVAGVRRRLGAGLARRERPKVGHAGTLDPFATGLLVVLVGRATRLAPYLSGLDKTYLATARLGVVSATGDPEGPIATAGPVPPRADVAAALAGLVGPQRQRVPALSAVSVDGERLYKRARRGEAVELPEREVVVHEARLLPAGDLPPDRVRFEARVSKGTYLRQLAVDLGERLGCGAYCEELRRTAVGALTIDRAVAPEAVAAAGGIGLAEALAHLPTHHLTDAEREVVRHGRPVCAPSAGRPPTPWPLGQGAPVALLHERELVAVAHADEEGRLRPAVVLP